MDYYSILGLESRNVSDVEIKRAYKKKALEHHPDKGGDQEEFKKISVAFSVLGDQEQRLRYDNGDLDFNFGNFDFSSIFQGECNVKRNDHIYELKVSLKNIYFGMKKTLKITIKSICLECKKVCNRCKGSNLIIHLQNFGPFSLPSQTLCNCDNGFIVNKNVDCKCENYINTKDHNICIDVGINIKDNDILQFKGLGEQSSKGNEIPGDLLIKCTIEKDMYFERSNSDLIYRYKLSLTESIVGKYIIIPHYSGDVGINTNIYGIIDPNKKYILKNKGLNSESDLIFVFEIEYSENFNKNEKELLLNFLKT
jgi:DnaJ family protein A protein 2